MSSLIREFFSAEMTYTNWSFMLLVLILAGLYYIVPVKIRWLVLLAGSAVFYYSAVGRDAESLLLFGGTIAFSYAGGLILSKHKNRWLRDLIILISVLPLLIVKGNVFIARGIFHRGFENLLAPLGLSFYSLQIYAYLYDVYKGRISPEKNILKYSLFISYFSQIMQGPIPRYSALGSQLFGEHRFNSDETVKGFQLVLWGFFLKYMIAEKAAIVVNTVFSDSRMYQGVFSLVAGILYSIQLYADFLACVCICKGVSELFGIHLGENFLQPYRSRTIKEFWRRWHISLSTWLRDYVYIPLGGSRKGKLRKYINLTVTFLISGAWHGNGYRFIAWGLLHAVYQILGDFLRPVTLKLKKLAGIKKDSKAEIYIDRIVTFSLVMLAWIIFRADSLHQGIDMAASIFRVHNVWVLFDDSLLTLGLEWKEICLLLMSVCLLFRMEAVQEKGSIREKIIRQPLIIRWAIYFAAIAVIIIFGMYGFGFNSSDFIYRGF